MITLAPGDTHEFSASISPDSAIQKAVTWHSSNVNIVDIDENGRATARRTGIATVHTITVDGMKTDSATVSVVSSNIAVSGVSIDQETLALHVGGTEKLTATVSPAGASNKAVRWYSDDTSVATVDEATGVIQGIGEGSTKISVITVDGGYTDTIDVSVEADTDIHVTGVDIASSNLSVNVGDTKTLNAVVSPENATDKGLTWTSSNSDIASVDNNGMISAKNAGSAIITVTTNDGGYTDTVTVSVVSGFTINASAGTGGAVTGGGEYSANSTVTLIATPNTNYSFDGWYENDVKISGAKATYVFTAESDRTLEARFTYEGSSRRSGGGSSGVIARNASIATTDVGFDKNVSEDISVTLNMNGYTLNALKNSDATLKPETDYTVSGNTLTIKKGYLNTLAEDEYILIIDMSGGVDPRLKVTIRDRASSGGMQQITSAEQENPFTDITGSDWFYDDVIFAYEEGLMSGTNTDPMTFSPNMTLTRSMLVTILYRHAGEPQVDRNDSSFNDVPDGQWYTNAISWAAANGIVSGYGNGIFGTNDEISRQDLAVILMRYMNYLDVNIAVTQQYIMFADEPDISDYAKNAIQTLHKLDIISGVGNDKINPKDKALRVKSSKKI